MQVVIDGRRVSLRAEDALGDGGEATVTRVGELAVKVYHQPSEDRARKLDALLALGPALPGRVVAPTALVRDAKGKRVVGFAMRALAPGHDVLAALSRRAARAQRGLGPGAVAAIFLDAHATLGAIHAAGLVVGDLNDMNETFSPDPTGALTVDFLDVDSFQLPGHPCEVATEAFLDPDLYGPDLAAPVATAGGAPRAFRPANDWYSFAVLLFRSLTLVHPYGGVDPSLPSLPRRAAARRSVLAPGVTYPSKVGYALETLSDELVALFGRVFDRGAREVFPADALRDYASRLVRCGSCGAEHPAARARCPSCAARAPVAPTASAAGCEVEVLIEARGPILALSVAGGWVRAVALEDGRATLHARRGREVARVDLGAADGATLVDLGPRAVVVARSGDPASVAVHALDGGRVGPAIVSSTERFAGGEAAIVVTTNGLARVARGTAMACRVEGDGLEERPLFEVMRGQTRLFASTEPGAADVVIASQRVFGERRYAIAVGPRRVDLALATLEPGEALVDEGAAFSPSTAALLRHTQKGGADRVRVDLVAHDGRALGATTLAASTRPAGTAVRGGLLAAGSLLFATDRGVTRERLADDGRGLAMVEQRVFSATEPFSARDARLVRDGDALVVAFGATVRRLRMT